MKANTTPMRILTLVLLPVMLWIAFVSDRLATNIMKTAQTSGDFRPTILVSVAANLLAMAAALATAWLALFSSGRSRLVGIIYLITGILMMITPVSALLLDISNPPFSIFSISPLRDFRMELMAHGLSSRFAIASAFVTVVGLVDLFLPNKHA